MSEGTFSDVAANTLYPCVLLDLTKLETPAVQSGSMQLIYDHLWKKSYNKQYSFI